MHIMHYKKEGIPHIILGFKGPYVSDIIVQENITFICFKLISNVPTISKCTENKINLYINTSK